MSPCNCSWSAHLLPSHRPLWTTCELLRQQHTANELNLRNILWRGHAILCSKFERVILTLSANVGIKSASSSAFGLVPSGTFARVLICYITDWLMNAKLIFWKRFYCGCLIMSISLFYFSTTRLQRSVNKMSGGGWKRYTQEVGLDIEGRLNGFVVRRIQLRWISCCVKLGGAHLYCHS
jgi:hypothetical protein